ISIGPHWQADLGLRWDRVHTEYDNVAATGVRTAFERTDAAPSGHAGVVFKPSPAGSVYASYSTSFSPSFDGAFGLTLTAATSPPATFSTPPIRSRPPTRRPSSASPGTGCSARWRRTR